MLERFSRLLGRHPEGGVKKFREALYEKTSFDTEFGTEKDTETDSCLGSILELLKQQNIIESSEETGVSNEQEQENNQTERTLAQTINAPAVELFRNELNQEFKRIRKIIKEGSEVEKSDLRRLIEISLALIMTRNSKAVLNPRQVRGFIERLFNVMFCFDISKGEKADMRVDNILFNEADFAKRLESMADYVTRYTDSQIEQKIKQKLNSKEFQDFLVEKYPDEATRPKSRVTIYLGLGDRLDDASLYFGINPGIKGRKTFEVDYVTNFPRAASKDSPNMSQAMRIGEKLGLEVLWGFENRNRTYDYTADPKLYGFIESIPQSHFLIIANNFFKHPMPDWPHKSMKRDWFGAFTLSRQYGSREYDLLNTSLVGKNYWELILQEKFEDRTYPTDIRNLNTAMSEKWLGYYSVEGTTIKNRWAFS